MEDQALLIIEQCKHMVDAMDAKLDRIELNQVHLKEMTPNNGDRSNTGLTILKCKGKTTKRG